MSTVRSPNYPSIDLGAALDAVRPAYKAEHRHKMSRLVLAEHLGYTSLNGRALAKIGAVRAYGLIEGVQDELRISDDARECFDAPLESRERAAALERCALKPPIFAELSAEFGVTGSEANLRYFLTKRNYTPEAASKAVQTYLATMRLVRETVEDYGGSAPAPEAQPMETAASYPALMPTTSPMAAKDAPPPIGTRKAVFTLGEGDVTLTFPDNLSPEGYEELGDYLKIFLRRAQRQKAGTAEQ